MKTGLELAHITTDGKDINGKPIPQTDLSLVESAFKAKKPIFVDFYMNGCFHCVNLEPDWNKMLTQAKQLYGSTDVVIAAIESKMISKITNSEMKELTKNINGFPTIGAFVNKKFIKYNKDDRSVKSLLEFLKETVVGKKGGGFLDAPRSFAASRGRGGGARHKRTKRTKRTKRKRSTKHKKTLRRNK